MAMTAVIYMMGVQRPRGLFPPRGVRGDSEQARADARRDRHFVARVTIMDVRNQHFQGGREERHTTGDRYEASHPADSCRISAQHGSCHATPVLLWGLGGWI